MNLKQKFLTVLCLSSTLAACSNEFSFNEVLKSCEPPESSARYGKNLGPVITSPDANAAFQGTTTIAGTCEPGYPLTMKGTGIPTPIVTECSTGNFSVEVTFTESQGTKEIDVTQPTLKGQDVLDRRCFLKDSIPPKVTISGSTGAQSTNVETVRVEGTCENGLDVVITGPNLIAPVTTACTRGRFNAEITFTGPDGLKDVVATQEDRAGNQGEDDKQYLTDTTPPAVAITGPAVNFLTRGPMTLVGTCEGNGRVVLSGALLGGVTITNCVNGNFSQDVELSVGDGVKNVIATQTDEAGNAGSSNRNFRRDATPPAVAITAPAAGTVTTSNLNLSGTCEDGLLVNIAGSGIVAPTSVACSGGTFVRNITLSAPDGSKEIIASQTDAAGNTGTSTRSFIRDATGPNVTITDPAAGTVWASGLTLRGNCESGLLVTVAGSGSNGSQTVACNSGAYVANVTFTAGDGAKTITASQTDAVGNTGSATRNFIRDSSAPSLQITAPAANSYVPATATISGNCETGTDVRLNGAGVQTTIVTACAAGNFSALVTFTAGDGNKTVVATQTDAVGNTATDSRTFIKDTTDPIITITSPAANTVAQTGVTLQGTCESGLTVNLSGAGLHGPATTACNAGNFSVAVTFTAGDGNKNIVASQTDAAGNVGTATRTFIRDNTAPVVVITDPAAGTPGQTGLTVQGTCESGLGVLIAGSGVANSQTVACVGNAFSVNVTFTAGDGNKIVTASQTDAAGNTGSDSETFVRDNAAPSIAITSPAANSFVASTAVIGGNCQSGIQVVLAGAGVQGSVTTACNSGSFSASVTFTAGDGNKIVTASQTDAASNTASDSRTFIRDSVGPVVTITSPAANTVAQNGVTLQGTCESGLTVNLSGAGLQGPASTACNAGTFTVAINFSAGDGGKTITASQTDGAGNTGSASRVFQRDTTAPAIAFTAPAANSIVGDDVTVTGTCETGLQVTLSGAGVAGDVVTACNAGGFSAVVFMTAGDGNKVVTATQTDAVGNVGTANRTFVRDATGPSVAITSPAANSYVGATAVIGGTCESGLLVTLAGAGVQTSVNTACNSGSFSATVTFTAGDGVKTVTASQTDAGGNTGSGSRNFVRDSTAPIVTITSPAANTVAQNGVTLQGTCENGLVVNLGGAGLQGPASMACNAGTFSVAITFSNGDGNKVITASQTDAAGNTGSASRTFVRDATAPVITITSPAAMSVVGDDVTVTGTCETGIQVVLWGPGVASDVTTACNAGTFSALVTLTAGDGNKEVRASQTDAVGNYGTASRTFVRDTAGPAVAIVTPAAMSYVAATATITGTCESGLQVLLTGAGLQGSVTTACNSGNFSALVTFSVGDGNKAVTATQTDAASNVGSDTRTFVRDGTAPLVTISSPAANSVHDGTLTLTGACENGLVVNLGGAGLQGPASTACAGSTYSVVITMTNGDGNKNITVSQTDAAGNTGTAARTFVRDSTAPVIVITGPAAGTVARTGVTLVGTCETGLTVNLGGAGLQGPATTTCSAGAFSVAITFSAGDGVKTITASQTDAIGNTGTSSRDFVRDNTAPVVAITAPAAGTSSATGLTVSGTCETGLLVTLAGDVSATVTTPCNAGVFSAAILFSANNGSKTITASQTDAAGNTGSGSRTFQRNNSAGYDSFISKGPGGMVDILFVDDNSASMDPEQAALGAKFNSFTTALAGLNWQVGITTTDCTAGSPYNICGSLLDMTGLGADYILDPADPNYLTVFQNTIQRPETANCLITGTCPSGREEGLKATINAFSKRATENAGFFRNGADLAVVYLMDEDEQSNAPATATTPAQVISAFNSTWGTTKKFSAYAIIVQPGDAACLATQRAQLGGNAYYGTYPNMLASLTGGISASICAPDYSVTMTQIGNDVTKLSKSVDLSNTPIAGTVSVVFTPAWTTTWSVSGNRVTFDNPAPAGTQIEIFYEY